MLVAGKNRLSGQGGSGTHIKKILVRLAVTQFVVYALLCTLGFVAWTWTTTETNRILERMLGSYIHKHLERWTTRFPLWGVFALISAVLSFGAARLLQNGRREGGYVAITSLLVGFATNLLFAQNLLVHVVAGVLIFWILLWPLAVLWISIESIPKQKKEIQF